MNNHWVCDKAHTATKTHRKGSAPCTDWLLKKQTVAYPHPPLPLEGTEVEEKTASILNPRNCQTQAFMLFARSKDASETVIQTAS